MDQQVLNVTREFFDNMRGHLAHARGAWEATLGAQGEGAARLRQNQTAALLAVNTVALESVCETLAVVMRELGAT